MKENVFILGINGYSGKAFKNYVTSRKLFLKYNFIGVDKFISDVNSEICILETDLSKNNWDYIFKDYKPDYIVNLVGRSTNCSFEDMISTNVILTQSLFEYILQNKISVKKILLIGSAAEYGRNNQLPLHEKSELLPVNFYGMSKLFQTNLAKYYHDNYSLPICIARTFNILGGEMPKTLAIGSFKAQISAIENGGTIFTGNLDTKRDYLHIDDVIDAYWAILIHGIFGEIYNVSSGKSIAIIELLNTLIANSGKSIEIITSGDKVKKNDIRDSFGSNNKLISLGWSQKLDVLTSI